MVERGARSYSFNMKRLYLFGSADLGVRALLTLSLVCAVASWPAEASAGQHDDLTRISNHSNPEYEVACRALPEFCREWQLKLDARAADQMDRLEWQDREGWKTATYSGFGPLQSCVCKLEDGTPVGKLTYDTIEYYIVGRTLEEARHAHAILAGRTKTLEIIRWTNGKWIYQ